MLLIIYTVYWEVIISFGEVADILLESGKMTYTEYYKANNFLDIAKKADEFYSEMNSSNSNKVYDFDWFF